jgi:hypothetical protein
MKGLAQTQARFGGLLFCGESLSPLTDGRLLCILTQTDRGLCEAQERAAAPVAAT